MKKGVKLNTSILEASEYDISMDEEVKEQAERNGEGVDRNHKTTKEQ